MMNEEDIKSDILNNFYKLSGPRLNSAPNMSFVQLMKDDPDPNYSQHNNSQQNHINSTSYPHNRDATFYPQQLQTVSDPQYTNTTIYSHPTSHTQLVQSFSQQLNGSFIQASSHSQQSSHSQSSFTQPSSYSNSSQSSDMMYYSQISNIPSHSQLINSNTVEVENYSEKGFLLQFLKSPSLKPWPGQFGFSATPGMEMADNKKCCYSEDLKKLYVTIDSLFPIDISLNNWVDDMYILIVPVFQNQDSRHKPVGRCYNHVKADHGPNKESILHAEINCTMASNEVYGERHAVRLPLSAPMNDETSITMSVKSKCLTSCVGGPNRRPFVLLMMLMCNGQHVGTQVIEIRCCSLPSRDFKNEAMPKIDLKKGVKREISESSEEVDSCSSVSNGTKKNKKVKIRFLREFLEPVKKYYNLLIARDQVDKSMLPYPDA